MCARRNAASNEELFAALANDFVDQRLPREAADRTILNSSVYQLSRGLQRHNQIRQRITTRGIFRAAAFGGSDSGCHVEGDRCADGFPGYPVGTRALQLPDVQVKSEFLTSFGRPQRIICDAAERSSDPNIAQALAVINGDTLNKKLSDAGRYHRAVAEAGAFGPAHSGVHLYLSAFSAGIRPKRRGSRLLTALRKRADGDGSPEEQREAHSRHWKT